MNKLITIIAAALFLIGCGGPSVKVVTDTKPIVKKAPWESFNAEDRKLYKGCPEATKSVSEAKTWPLLEASVGMPNPQPMDENGHRFIEFRRSVDGGGMAGLQYRIEGGEKLHELSMHQYAGIEQAYFIVDFYTLRDTYLGIVSDTETDLDAIFSSATGEYFCLLP